MMKFCKNCGSILIHKAGSLVCRCGYSEKIDGDVKISELRRIDSQEVEIKEPSDKNVLAVYDNICERCGYGKAQIIERGIQYSDEDDYTLFKCGKCGFVKMLDAKVT